MNAYISSKNILILFLETRPTLDIMTLAEEPSSRNIDELKRLVITALDRCGVLSDLRSTVKLHVARAINEDPQAPLMHQRNPRVTQLLASDRGQLLVELVVEFLRFYDLKDTVSMLLVEGNLPRLRPSETEVASRCGFSRSLSQDVSLLEQLLSFRQQQEDRVPLLEAEDNIIPAFSPPQDVSDDASSPVTNTSLDGEMRKMRNISQEIERISLGSTNRFVQDEDPADSPRYEDDFDSAPSVVGISAREFVEEIDVTPLPRAKRNGFTQDDDVLFASRESLKELGVAPSRLFPMEKNDRVEPFEAS
jgi:hypothetical protein